MELPIPSQKPLVSSQWLANQLNNPQIVVVDCRFQLENPNWGYQQYLTNHILGAYYLNLDHDLSSAVQKHGGRHPLPDSDSLAQKLSTLGIEMGKTWVVAYDDARFAFASRLWWLLHYLGHSQVFILDGGWNAWIAGKYPVTSEIPQPRPRQFNPFPQSNWIVDIETVKARKDLPSVILVDSRSGDRFRGEQEPIDPIAGHIPGAINLPWTEVTDAQGYFQSPTVQQNRWSAYRQAEEIIVYCGSGVTACVNLLSLAAIEIDQVKLYPGGWSDWCSYLLDHTHKG